mmetsp:Transcript_8205/g.14853  ORF Transcript_8205/g.14853 Transcript_8205/m.14853 type:complete len:108 (+) Transcript_8205:1043-1366(+)
MFSLTLSTNFSDADLTFSEAILTFSEKAPTTFAQTSVESDTALTGVSINFSFSPVPLADVDEAVDFRDFRNPQDFRESSDLRDRADLATDSSSDNSTSTTSGTDSWS